MKKINKNRKHRKQMTARDDELCWELHEKGWSYRRIAQQLRRSHRSIPAAIERHLSRDKTEQKNNDKKVVDWEKFNAWVREGRRYGWDHVLINKSRESNR